MPRPGMIAGLLIVALLVGVIGFLVIRADSTGAPVRPAGAGGSASPPTDAPRSIVDENSLPGDTTWMIEYPALSQEIQGYAGQVSVQAGDTLDLFVSTKGGGKFDAEIYRMGWYGGDGARLMRTLRDIDGRDQGRWDPVGGLRDCRTCAIDPATLLVEANWRVSHRLRIPDDWMSGVYLVKLRDQSSNTSSYVTFVLRDDTSTAPVLVQLSTNTWQARNNWGDASLFGAFGADRRYMGPQRRAYRVSYDRPYDVLMGENLGAGEFLTWEYNFVRWAESRGYEMTYTTNVDVHQLPASLTTRRVFVSLGRDEFWTKTQRDAVESAREAGVNLLFLGAKTSHWQARLEPSTSGADARVLTSYREANLDPVARLQPAETTSEFALPPVNRPPSTLTGVAHGAVPEQPYAAWYAAGTDSWIYEGTGIAFGEPFAGILGDLYDHMAPADRRPQITVVGSTPVNGEGIGDDAAISALYTASSGATVFSAGAVAWSWGLDDYGHEEVGSFADDRLRRLTGNILDRMIQPRTVPQAE